MLTVDDYDELLALNRALMEVRYHADHVRADTRGSAHLTRVHVRVIDEIIIGLDNGGRAREADGWRNWRKFENREIERPEILRYLREVWSQLSSDEQRREVARNQMSPFEFSHEDVQRILAEVGGGAPVE